MSSVICGMTFKTSGT